MFTIALRLDKRRIAAATLAAAMIGAGSICCKELFWNYAVRTGSEAAAGTISTSASTPQERLDFIHAYGWEVEQEPVEVRDVVIPSEFDEIYEKYNYLQKQQGFDLSRQRGKPCRRYVYAVTNYPAGAEQVRLTLLVYRGRVVGGDISSASANGFMHGFDGAEATWIGLPQQESAQPVGTVQS